MRADGGRRDNQTAQGAARRRLVGAYAVRIGPAVEDMSQSMSKHQVNQNSSLLDQEEEEEEELLLSPTAVGGATALSYCSRREQRENDTDRGR